MRGSPRLVRHRYPANRMLSRFVGLALVIALGGCNPFEKSEYSHCVIAHDAASFTGKKLKNDGNARSQVSLTTACIEEDRKLDGADGRNKGRVRWVVCLKGPDCDEAGMF